MGGVVRELIFGVAMSLTAYTPSFGGVILGGINGKPLTGYGMLRIEPRLRRVSPLTGFQRLPFAQVGGWPASLGLAAPPRSASQPPCRLGFTPWGALLLRKSAGRWPARTSTVKAVWVRFANLYGDSSHQALAPGRWPGVCR
jgi:hypothetical protein